MNGASAVPRHLVLGAAIGYAEHQIAPFLRSLRGCGYRGDVVLLVDRRDAPRLRRSPLFEGVTLHGVSNWLPLRFRWLQSGVGERWVWRPVQALLWLAVQICGVLPEGLRWPLQTALGGFLYAPTESRFLRYWQRVRRSDHARVLLSDVRDVLFQAEPFAALPESGLAVSMEVPDYTIGTERWNSSRVRLIYGDAVLREVADHPVSCSGVTAGDAASMTRYLELMARHITRLGRRVARQGWFDQAIHNVVLRVDWDGPLHALHTLCSAVATLGAVPDWDIRTDDAGRVLNKDGAVVNIVHQYDRKPRLRDALPELLGRPQ